MRVLVVVLVAACDAGPPPPPVPVDISAADSCVADVVTGPLVRLRDSTGLAGLPAGTALAVGDGWFRLADAPAPVRAAPIAPRHDHVDAALVGAKTVVTLRDDQHALGSYRFAAPACARTIEALRWWDAGNVVVAIDYACERPTCALVALPMPKDLPES